MLILQINCAFNVSDLQAFKTYAFAQKVSMFQQYRCVERRLQISTTDVIGSFHGYASAYDSISKGCSGEKIKGHFSVDVTGPSFRLPSSIPYQFHYYPQCVKKIYYPSMSDDRFR